MNLLLATCAGSEEERQAIGNAFGKLLSGEEGTPVNAAHPQAYANGPQAEYFEGISLPILMGIESVQNRLLLPHRESFAESLFR